jgi:superfamily I DNA and RNA helicase
MEHSVLLEPISILREEYLAQIITIPQDLQLAYSDIIRILSDPLSTSSVELELANQMTETYKKHEALGSEGSYEELCQQGVTLQEYIEYKNLVYDKPCVI